MRAEANRWMAVAVLMGVTAALVGCGGGGDDEYPAAPRDVLARALTAMANLDRKMFVGCLTGTDDERRAAGAMVDFVRAGWEFQEAFVEAYGQQAWESFQDKEGARLKTTVEGDLSKLAQVQCRIDGDVAACSMPGDPQVVHLDRRDGRWYVRARDLVGIQGSPRRAADLWGAFAAAIRRARDRIGQPGVTGEQLDTELGRDLMAAVIANRSPARGSGGI